MRDAAIRFRYLILLTYLCRAFRMGGRSDWAMLATEGRNLFGHLGLHLYAEQSWAQAGPPSLLVVRAMDVLLGSAARTAFIGWAVIQFLWMVFLAERMAARLAARPLTRQEQGITLVAGLAAAYAWILFGLWTHVDDALAVSLMVLALCAASRRRPLQVALFAGLACAFKPWAVAAGGLLLVHRRRPRLGELSCFVLPSVVCWAPFLLADKRTLATSSAGYRTMGWDAPLRIVLGELAPTWLRAAQLAAILLVAVLVARYRDWRLTLTAALCMRLLLERQEFTYYSATTIAVCALTEIVLRKAPWRTLLLTFALIAVPPVIDQLVDYRAEPLVVTTALLRAFVLLVVIVDAMRSQPAAGLAKQLVPAPRTSADVTRASDIASSSSTPQSDPPTKRETVSSQHRA